MYMYIYIYIYTYIYIIIRTIEKHVTMASHIPVWAKSGWTPGWCWAATAVESSWNLMAHGDAREGKWRGNWWMEWVSSTLTLPRNTMFPALLPLTRTPRLPAVDWTDAPADLNGLVRFGERRNLFSACAIGFQTQSTFAVELRVKVSREELKKQRGVSHWGNSAQKRAHASWGLH